MSRNGVLTKALAGFLALPICNGIIAGPAAKAVEVNAATAPGLADQAQAKMRAKQWGQAANLWKRVVEMNPVVASYWAALGRAQYQAKEYKQAIAAYEKALDLRAGFPWLSAYRIACCHCLLGDKAQALSWLDKAFAMGFRNLEEARTNDDLKSLHSEPRFRKLVGLIDTAKMTRTEGWRYDIELLVRELKRLHYNLSRLPAPEGFDALAKQLHDDVPSLTDRQLEVGLMKLVRLAGDAHTTLIPPYTLSTNRTAIPVQFYLFDEKLFIIRAAPAHKDLAGAQVLRFGTHTVNEVRLALDPLISRDNAMWPKFVAPGLMRNPQVLNGLGLIPEDDKVTLTVQATDATVRRVTLAATAGDPGADWVSDYDQTPGPEPLYLKNRTAPYWFDYLPATKTVYFQYNAVLDDPKEPLDKFCERLFGFIGKHEVDKLVIDMRLNGGGNAFLNGPLIHGLICCEKVNRRGHLFVIIGRNTISAAQSGATHIERYTNAIFVGEPTGSCPNFVGETCPLTLPYSHLVATISDLYWQNSVAMDYRTWLAPQIYTPPTFESYRGKKDPSMEAILSYRPE
jgi:tetratricopeptide (TPR) repeat protein